MKKSIIVFAALFFTAKGFSQTIVDPSVKVDSLNKILINPVQLSMMDTTKAVSMKIVSIMDDLTSSAQFYISLYDVNNRKISEKNMTITESEYVSWDRKVGYVARLFCTKYGLTLK
jgi:hypothetical protein